MQFQVFDKNALASKMTQSKTVNAIEQPALMDLNLQSGMATIKPPTITLNDIFLSVKTTKSNHASRLDIIIKTWFQLAKAQVKRNKSY